MSDLYKDKWLRRWSLDVTGTEVCVEQAVNIELISPEDRAAIEAKNAEIHAAIGAVTALETARKVEQPAEDVTRTFRVYDEPTLDEQTGETVEHWHMEARPEWQAWDDAQEVIVAATDGINALARIRAGIPNEEDPDLAETDASLVEAEWGGAVTVTVLPEFPDLEPSQFEAIIRASGYASDLDGYFASIADPVLKAIVSARRDRAKVYDRYDPSILAAQQMIGIPAVELDALWLWGADLPV